MYIKPSSDLHPVNTFLGIDPGKKGAFCLIDADQQVLMLEDMPLERGKIPPRRIFDIYFDICQRGHKPFSVIEKPHSRPTDARNSIATYHWEAGQLMMICAFDWPLQLIPPAIWAKSIHVGLSQDLKPKVKSKQAFQNLFPKLAKTTDFIDGKKVYDGRIDALLIAEYGRRLYSGKSN